MASWATSWPARLGFATDRLLNVLLFNGLDTETVSWHAATAEAKGRRWGCWTCWLLAKLIQAGHCRLTLDPAVPETPGAAARAGLLMLVGLACVAAAFVFLVRAL